MRAESGSGTSFGVTQDDISCLGRQASTTSIAFLSGSVSGCQSLAQAPLDGIGVGARDSPIVNNSASIACIYTIDTALHKAFCPEESVAELLPVSHTMLTGCWDELGEQHSE